MTERKLGTGSEQANRARAVSGFALYDVANSAFVTVVITAIGGPFVASIAESAERADGRVRLLGLTPSSESVYAYAVSLSIALQVLAFPLLGALAESPRTKRALLVAGTVVGAAATVVLAAAPRGAVLLAVASLVLANAAFGVALLSYNAYLADVAELADRDRVSARGYAFGYAGGAVVLGLTLALVSAHSAVGLTTSGAGRVSIVVAALWWLVLGLLAVRRLDAARDLPGALPETAAVPLRPRIRRGLTQVRSGLAQLRELPGTARYLASFLLFNDAIQAVIGLSSVFLSFQLFEAKGRDPDEATGFLLSLVLLIQVVAVAGAWGSARLAARFGARKVLLASLVLWTGVVLYAALALDSTTAAYGLGVVIALVLGGSQALARSLFSAMVPDDRQASFFAFFALAERGTAFIGPLVFGVVYDATGSYDDALLSLLVLFVSGGLLLASTDTDAAVARAQQAGHPME